MFIINFHLGIIFFLMSIPLSVARGAEVLATKADVARKLSLIKEPPKKEAIENALNFMNRELNIRYPRQADGEQESYLFILPVQDIRDIDGFKNKLKKLAVDDKCMPSMCMDSGSGMPEDDFAISCVANSRWISETGEQFNASVINFVHTNTYFDGTRIDMAPPCLDWTTGINTQQGASGVSALLQALGLDMMLCWLI